MYSIRINFFFSNIKYKNYLYFILTNKMMRKLNALKFDDKNIENIKKFIQYNELPKTFSDLEKERFTTNFKDFILINDTLI